jgi:RHS repeat-associated protein
MPLRFPGQYFDRDTNVHYNYFRDYDPTLGRFVEGDPIGLRGGVNLYAYVDSDPLSFVDLKGLVKRDRERGERTDRDREQGDSRATSPNGSKSDPNRSSAIPMTPDQCYAVCHPDEMKWCYAVPVACGLICAPTLAGTPLVAATCFAGLNTALGAACIWKADSICKRRCYGNDSPDPKDPGR